MRILGIIIALLIIITFVFWAERMYTKPTFPTGFCGAMVFGFWILHIIAINKKRIKNNR